MRRHTLDPDSIKRQIKSVFTSPTRKLLSFTNNNNNNNTNGNSIINFARRARRFSVPEKQSSDRLDVNPELHTIHEVSQLEILYVHACFAAPFACRCSQCILLT